MSMIFGALGASWELSAAPRGLLGAMLDSTANMISNSNVERSTNNCEAHEYQHVHKLMNLEHKGLMRKAMVKGKRQCGALE